MVELVNIKSFRTAAFHRRAFVQQISVANVVKCARQFNASTVELVARILVTDIDACALRDTQEWHAKLIDVEIIAKIMDNAI